MEFLEKHALSTETSIPELRDYVFVDPGVMTVYRSVGTNIIPIRN
jgi:hypothetical protein